MRQCSQVQHHALPARDVLQGMRRTAPSGADHECAISLPANHAMHGAAIGHQKRPTMVSEDVIDNVAGEIANIHRSMLNPLTCITEGLANIVHVLSHPHSASARCHSTSCCHGHLCTRTHAVTTGRLLF
eukprot:UN2756